MQKFYFTFNLNHVLAEYVRPIMAKDIDEATAKMFEMYGKDWGFDYTEEQYNRGVAEGSISVRKELATVYCTPVMKVGEMLAWTRRYESVIRARGSTYRERLDNLKSDLELAYPGLGDSFAAQLHATVADELEVIT